MTNEEIVEEIYHEAYSLGFIDELRQKIESMRHSIENHKLSHSDLVYKAYYMLKEEEKLNSTLDFSFDYHYTSVGDWGNASYAINVPNKTSVEIPEKETMFTIPISSIKKKDDVIITEI